MRRHRSPRRRAHWDYRRRIAAVIVVLIFLAPFVAVGWYARNVTNAIGDAQSVSVVQLPTRDDTLQQMPDSEPGGTPVVGPRATPVQSSETSGEPAPTATDTDSPSSFDITVGLIRAGTNSEDISPQQVWPDKRFINILVLGVDSRGDGGDQNADVIILARLDLEQHTLRSISLPRDLEVEIPGHGPGKINGSYGIGLEEDPDNRVAGVAKVRDTVEYNFGVMIDEYVLIDFEGFTEVVDAIGGIDITVPEKIVDEAYPTEDYGTRLLVIEAGRQHMDGETALSYARTRHQDSDDQRRERQMLVIQALLQQGQKLGSLTRVADLITALSGAALTSFQFDEQLALAAMALRIEEGQIQMVNLEQPIIQPGTSADGAWIYTGDINEIRNYIESALAGEIEGSAVPGL
jgi:LCP family protein required for cell wall assembly